MKFKWIILTSALFFLITHFCYGDSLIKRKPDTLDTVADRGATTDQPLNLTGTIGEHGYREVLKFPSDVNVFMFKDTYSSTNLSFLDFYAEAEKGIACSIYADVGADGMGSWTPNFAWVVTTTHPLLPSNAVVLNATNADYFQLRSYSSGIDFMPNNDNDDYIQFKTTSDVPEILTVGGCDLKITPSGNLVLNSNTEITDTHKLILNQETTGSMTTSIKFLSQYPAFYFGYAGSGGIEFDAGLNQSAYLNLFADVGEDGSGNWTNSLQLIAYKTGETFGSYIAGTGIFCIKNPGDNPIIFQPNSDGDDYISLITAAHQTTINFVGQDGRITADGGTIDFDDDNLTTTGSTTTNGLTSNDNINLVSAKKLYIDSDKNSYHYYDSENDWVRYYLNGVEIMRFE